jgi:lipoprotein-anchoring transpeptidase ErfK/SrfK
VFVVHAKSDRPEWRAPDSEWVPEAIRGRVFRPGDPDNPIVGAFLAIWDGVGIHGTMALESLGTAASHGCIRVSEQAADQLYRRVPVGTPVVVL